MKHYLLKLCAMLVVVLTSAQSAFAAWEYEKIDGTEGGGGTYNFRCEQKSFGYDGESWNCSHLDWFWTRKRFDATKEQYYLEFEFRVIMDQIIEYDKSDWNMMWHDSEVKQTKLDGEVYVVTADDVMHLVATWRKDKTEGSYTPYEQTDKSYSGVYVTNLDTDNGHVTVRMLPNSKAFTEGVKRVVFKNRMIFKDTRQWGWFQYEKDIDLTSLTGSTPMPRLNAAWNDEGSITFKATGMADWRSNKNYLDQYYYVNRYAYNGYKRSYGNSFDVNDTDMTLTEAGEGLLDAEFKNWFLSDGAYTIPVYVSSYAAFNYNSEGKNLGYKNWWFHQPRAVQLVKPYTRPEQLKVEFDKWTVKNTITWERRKKACYYDGARLDSVECLTDGTWYVLRYDKGNDPVRDGYTLLGSVKGTSQQLKLVDDKIEYDHQYVYRVVFLPDILEEKYKDKLVTLPGQSDSHSTNDLWDERTVSTLMEVPIKLTQDRSFDSAVRLVWEYNIQLKGLDWRIDYRPSGTETWKAVGEQLPIDVKLTETHYDTEGTVCDMVDYRVMTTVNGKEIYSNVLQTNLPAGSYISDVTATTGTLENSVQVKWKVARADRLNETKYRVLRRPIGATAWTLLADDIKGTASEYEYIDTRVEAGTYYEYTVEAYDMICAEQFVQTDAMVTPGFSQARGTITGHISFGTGTAVAGVRVNLVKSSTDDETELPQYLSRFIDGEGKGVQWTADSTKYASVLNGRQALTLQLWAKPQMENGTDQQELLHLDNALELGLKMVGDQYHLYAVDLSSGETSSQLLTHDFPSLKFKPYDFTHIAAIYKDGQWTLAVGSDTLLTSSFKVNNTDWQSCTRRDVPTLSLGGSNRVTGDAFGGNVDDVRLWRRALSMREIRNNYCRILGGIEEGLVLYWPFDEGINVVGYAFDVTRQDGIYLLNHPELGAGAVPSDLVPSGLSLYGLTDSAGDYIIRGIPFQQGGTNYKVVPALGGHAFNPHSTSMFVSPTSITANSVNFEDVSAFPMEGYICYAGTNIPAEGIMFYVDGDLLSGDGKAKTTDANGYYRISVPIGEHYVEAKLDGHTMAWGGRFPREGTYNFRQAMTYNFADSTLVNFVGRVAGGQRNDTLAVGFGASNNNIGMATLQLKLQNESFSFNCGDDRITPRPTTRAFESDTTSIRSRAWAGAAGDSKYIYIRTDSLTGEFSALLPPLKYITKNVTIGSNPNIEFTSLPEIDLTNVKAEIRDSLRVQTEAGEETTEYYIYNTKKVFTHFATPELEVTQGDNPRGAFGEKEILEYELASGDKADIKDIWTLGADGSVSYKYGYPIFQQDEPYTFTIRGYEAYANRDARQVVTDTIPMSGQVITISNEMSDEQSVVGKIEKPDSVGYKVGEVVDLKKNQLQLSDEGIQKWTWGCGVPNVVAPYTRNLSASYERNGRTYVWNELFGIPLGALSQGNNFVTEGPDKPLMVLRDPPGSKSKTTWKTGTVKTKIRTRNIGWTSKDAFVLNMGWGINMKTVEGMGFAIVSKYQVNTIIDLKFTYQHELMSNHTETWTTTANKAISTGTDIYHVGKDGDVFIGISNNLVLSDCSKVGFFRQPEGNVVLDCRDASMLSMAAKTSFYYSTYEIKNTMIPKWQELRNNLLKHVGSQQQAEDYVNTSGESIYLTWLNEDDENYGKEDTYAWKAPEGKAAQNMVSYYNEQVRLWEQVLAQNERDKVNAILDKNNCLKENISFDGGTSYSYSERKDTSDVRTHSYAGSGTVFFNSRHHLVASSGGFFDSDWGVELENGVKWSDVDSDYDDNVKTYAEFDYDFSDGNRGTDFSVDIYRSPAGWSDSFYLVGGQSYNPYEGPEYAEYFEPEKKHVISNGTQQMEQPDIQISTDGSLGAETLTLTDIPAGQSANLVLHLSNMNKTQQPFDMTYNIIVVEGTNNSGLQILMDGVPINGRSILIPKGETVLKSISIRQTDQSQLDHKGIKLRLCSPYQATKIYDEVVLNAQFMPASSPVDLVINDPIVNDEMKGKLGMKVTGFDRNFRNLKQVGVQYRFAGNTTWSTLCAYLVNRSDSTQVTDLVLPASGDLRLELDMNSDLSYPQGDYTFRAFTMTKFDKDDVYAYSKEVSVVKDNISPRALTTPTPAGGILGIGDDMSIEFNENIVPGYVGPKNVIVTAKLNNQPVKHDVALELYHYSSSAKTINPLFLNGDFSIEFWMKYTEGGVILCQGASTSLLSMGVNNAGQPSITLNGNLFEGTTVLPKDTWVYLAMNFNASQTCFSMIAEWDEHSEMVFDNVYIDKSAVASILYSNDNYLYLGRGVTGAIHSLSFYSVCLNLQELASGKYREKDNYVYALIGHWPLNEGHGDVAYDSRHTHDMKVTGRWLVDNVNYGLDFSKSESSSIELTNINTSAGDSYAIEFWFNYTHRACTLFETGSSPSTLLRLSVDSVRNLVLEYGDERQIVATRDLFPNESTWHHVALNVVRGQSASFYVDGKRTDVIAEQNIPVLEGKQMKLGEGYGGAIDELRIWHATLTERRLLSNMYNCLDTADVYTRGLCAYFPFEKSAIENGIPTKVQTLENMAPATQLSVPAMNIDNASFSIYSHAPLKHAPEETTLIASPVSSERKVVINLTGAGVTPRDIEGTTLNITVAQIHDLHGNVSQPIRWTAYVQQNPLKWKKDSVMINQQYGEGVTFDVNIENKGGTTEYYTIQNLPHWLSLIDSSVNDDVAPLTTKTLRFAVDPYAPVGDYDVNIGLQGNYEIQEPLRVTLKVRGEVPDWKVDPTLYEHQMHVIGTVRIDGLLMSNHESLVAAFIDGECRGVASPEDINGGSYVTLTVYGNSYASKDYNHDVSFSIFDATTGMTYTDAILHDYNNNVVDLAFKHDTIIGDFSHPALWTKSDMVQQSLFLHENWNWMSLGVVPSNSQPAKLLSAYDGWQMLMKDQASAFAWSSGTEWEGSLTDVTAGTMYKLKVDPLPDSPELPDRLTVTGRQLQQGEHIISLHSGWNWIGYSPLTTMTVDEALAGVNAQYGDMVKSQFGIALYNQGRWSGNLKSLESGHGYMYYNSSNEVKTFVYPVKLVSENRPLRVSARVNDAPRLFEPVDKYRYPDNMTMVIKLTEGIAVVDTAEVAAFIDGECRAATRAINGLYYLIIPGEGSNQPMQLYSYIDDRLLMLDNTQFYFSDSNIGTPWDPYVLDLEHLPNSIERVQTDGYDPDDDAWYNLQGIRLDGEPALPGIYIHRGQKVAIELRK